MKVTKWQDAEFSARLAVYDKYCEATKDFGFEPSTFEEFDTALFNSCFEAVETLYGIRG